ncbi:hypothetical protein G9A89_022933 [Geosiphon pyriformis]|nr:hypothetical protein G9A89_022933 [Geosiphon pyriformis]
MYHSLLSGAADSEIRLYDLERNSTPNSLDQNIRFESVVDIQRNEGHRYSVTCLKWYPNHSGYFASSSMDKTIKIWDVETMKDICTYRFDDFVYSLALSPTADHRYIAAALSHQDIRLCDPRSRLALMSLTGHTAPVFCVQWSPRYGFMLASGSADHTVRIWDSRRMNKCLISLDSQNKGMPSSLKNKAHDGIINGLSFTSDGLHLLTTGRDNTLRLWDIYTGKNTMVQYNNTYISNSTQLSLPLTITPLDECFPPLVFYPSSDSRILVFQLYQGVLVKQLRGPLSRINCAAYRRHRHELYSGDNDNRILVWRSKIEDQYGEDMDDFMLDEDSWSESE